MTDRYRDIKQKLCKYAEQDKDIKAVIAIGSSTRSEVPADEFSDLDLIIVTSAPDRWYSGEYHALLGNVSISFIEPTLGGGKERLLKMIGQYQLCFGDTDIWHDGRFLDRWADSSILDELKDCFAHYDNDDCRRA